MKIMHLNFHTLAFMPSLFEAQFNHEIDSIVSLSGSLIAVALSKGSINIFDISNIDDPTPFTLKTKTRS